MKLIIVLLMAFISNLGFASELTSLNFSSDGGEFTSTYRCKLVNSDLDLAIDCAAGAGIRDSFQDCKAFPCESCSIRSLQVTDSAGGRGRAVAIAHVKVILNGQKCSK